MTCKTFGSPVLRAGLALRLPPPLKDMADLGHLAQHVCQECVTMPHHAVMASLGSPRSIRLSRCLRHRPKNLVSPAGLPRDAGVGIGVCCSADITTTDLLQCSGFEADALAQAKQEMVTKRDKVVIETQLLRAHDNLCRTPSQSTGVKNMSSAGQGQKREASSTPMKYISLLWLVQYSATLFSSAPL